MITFIEILNYIVSLVFIGLCIFLGFRIKDDKNQRDKEELQAKANNVEYTARPPLIKSPDFKKKLYILLGLFIVNLLTLIIITKYSI